MRPPDPDPIFSFLSERHRRPPPFSAYTAEELWTDPHVAQQMLSFHLDPGEDLASRNHAFIQRSIEWLEETFDLSSGKRVLDLGCGPGLYSNGLSELGASVVGVDFSETSLAHARSSAVAQELDVDYRQANYLDLEMGETFDLILLIFGDFCPLGPGQRRHLLEKIEGWLVPGGRFVFDVASSALLGTVEDSAAYEAWPDGGFWSPRSHFLFTNRFKYPEEMAYLDRFTVIEEDRKREIFNWMQCYDRGRLNSELAEAGWVVERTCGDVAGGPWDPEADFFAVVAHPGE